MKNIEELEKININIWDNDYDNFNSQNTNMMIYVEDVIDIFDEGEITMILYPILTKFFKYSVTQVEYDDNKIWLIDISHNSLEELLLYLQGLNLAYKNTPLNIYSLS